MTLGPKPPHEYNPDDIIGDFAINEHEWILVAVEDGTVTLATFPRSWDGDLGDIPALSYVALESMAPHNLVTVLGLAIERIEATSDELSEHRRGGA